MRVSPASKGGYRMSHGEVPPRIPIGESRPDNFLDSWKEIAAYLGREVRTVQRWEKKEGLPVHRQIHEKLGTVYAYRSEIDAWWTERSAKLTTKAENGELSGGPRIVSWPVSTPEIPVEEIADASKTHKVPRLAVYAAAAAGLGAIVLGLYGIAHVYDWRFLRSAHGRWSTKKADYGRGFGCYIFTRRQTACVHAQLQRTRRGSADDCELRWERATDGFGAQPRQWFHVRGTGLVAGRQANSRCYRTRGRVRPTAH